jgi:hypothetical protein
MVKFGCDTIGTRYCFDLDLASNLSIPCFANSTHQSICRFIGVPYDPNAMYVSSVTHAERGAVPYLQTETDDYLIYLTTFQNTGTAVAHNVRLQIALSPLVDINTIAPSLSSDTYSWVILNDTLYVDFIGIELPDSTANEAESHGFFQFQIKPVLWNIPGSLINHTTHIYFDNNAAIPTNQSTVEIVDTNLTTNLTPVEGMNVMLYPNPSNDKIEIVSAEEQFELRISDMTGRIVLQGRIPGGRTSADVSSWSSGVYFIVVRSANRMKTLKFIRN